MARTLTIFQHGPTSFAVCGRCNGKSESKLLDLLKATEEIQDKYESHKCKRVSPQITQNTAGALGTAGGV